MRRGDSHALLSDFFSVFICFEQKSVVAHKNTLVISHDKKKTNCSSRVFYEWTPNSLGHEDHSEWQRRKTRLQWLTWPSTQRIGKVIRASSCFSIRRVVDLVPGASSTVMTEDRHDELAAIDLSMIVVALTPSWLVWISTVMPSYIFHHSCFFRFCFWTRNFMY